MIDVDLDEEAGRRRLAAWLYENRAGEVAKPMGDQVPGWSPLPGKCHDNVARWLEMNAGDKPVRGWLAMPYLTPSNRLRFCSHSVVERPSGELMDVTLTAKDGEHRFIRHPGPEAAFLAAVANNGLPTLEHVISPDAPQLPCTAELDNWPSDLI